MPMIRRYLLLGLLSLLVAGCASLGLREPIKVTVAGLEPLPSEGLETRFAVKLRVQNPNEVPLEFDGVVLGRESAGLDFGGGVGDQQGSGRRCGERRSSRPRDLAHEDPDPTRRLGRSLPWAGTPTRRRCC